MICHNSGTPAENQPCKQGADEGVAETDPGRGKTEVPAKLSGITDKNNGGKIRGTIGKGAEPRSNIARA